MRMEELANNNYIKSADSVERYLLDIIKQYFNSSNVDSDSREYIIQKAVERMKDELYIDNAGVVSINGKTGDVLITLESLNGEPKILQKNTAFNVNFGTGKNTACEGNDPRLSDDRHPLEHTHTMDNINGLAGELSSIRNTIDKLGNKTHKHENLSVLNLLRYTGEKEEIDLTILDTAADSLNVSITKTDKAITTTENSLITFLAKATEELNQYTVDFEAIKEYANEKDEETKTEIKTYIDEQILNKKEELLTELNNRISKDEFSSILSLINQQYQSLYEVNIINFVTSNESSINYIVTLPEEVIRKLQGLTSNLYKIELRMEYEDPILGTIVTNLPFAYAEAGKILYYINGLITKDFSIHINSKTIEEQDWPSFINNAKIFVKVFISNLLEV